MKDNKSGAIKRGSPDSNGSMETVSTVRSSCVHGDFVLLVPMCAWKWWVLNSHTLWLHCIHSTGNRVLIFSPDADIYINTMAECRSGRKCIAAK